MGPEQNKPPSAIEQQESRERAQSNFERQILPKVEEIGRLLQEPERDWKRIIQEVTQDIPNYERQRLLLPITEVGPRFVALQEERERLSKGFLRLTTHPEEVTETLRTAILRTIAQYYRDLARYHHMIGLPVPFKIPDFLTKYVELDAVEMAAYQVSRKMLHLQYDIREEKGLRSPRELGPIAGEIAIRAVERKDIRLSDLLACLRAADDNPHRLFLVKCDLVPFQPIDIEAVTLLAGYVAKYRGSLEKVLEQLGKGSVEELTMGEALEHLHDAGLGAFVSEVSLSIKAKGISSLWDPVDMRDVMERVSKVENLFPARLTEAVLMPLSGVQPRDDVERKKLQEDIRSAVSFFQSGKAKSVSLRTTKTEHNELTTIPGRIVDAVVDEVMSEEMVERLLQAAILPLNTKERELREEVRRDLHALVVPGNISAHDAFELYYWSHTPASAELLLGAKVVSLLQNYRKGDTANSLQVHMVDTLMELAKQDIRSLSADIDQLQLTDTQKRELRNVTMHLKEEGVDLLWDAADKIWKFVKKYPWILVIFFPKLTLKAAKLLVGEPIKYSILWKTTRRSADLARLAYLEGDELTKFLNIHGLSEIDIPTVHAAQKELRVIASQIDDLNDKWFWHRWEMKWGKVPVPKFEKSGLLRTADGVMEAMKTGEVNELAKALSKRHTTATALAQALEPAAESWDELQQALESAGHSTEKAKAAVDLRRRIATKPGGMGGPPEGPPKSPSDGSGPSGKGPGDGGGGAEKPRPKPTEPSGGVERAAGETADVADDAARQAGKAAEAGVEIAGDTKALIKELHEAKRLGKTDEVTTLLGKLEKASAAGDKDAQAFLRLVNRARAAETLGYAFAGLGLALDLYFIWENEEALKVEKNAAKRQVLLAKRESLKGEAATGFLLNGLSGFSIAIAGPLYAAETIYSDHIYRTILEHEMTREEWRYLDIRGLREKMRSMPIGYADAEHKWAHGKSFLEQAWYKLTTSRTKQEQDAKSVLAKVEKMNAMFRGEILEGFMLKTCALPQMLGEDDQKYRERESLALLDAVKYFNAVTKGSNYTVGLGPPFFEMAQDFMELSAMQRGGIDGTQLNLALDALRRGPKDPQVQEVLVRYRSVVKPVIALNALQYSRDIMRAAGKTADEIDLRISEATREMMLHDLVHRIVAADELIDQEVTWSQRDRVRFIVRSKLEGIVQDAAAEARRDNLTFDVYQSFIKNAQTLLGQAHKQTEGPTNIPNYPSEMHHGVNRRSLLDLVEKAS